MHFVSVVCASDVSLAGENGNELDAYAARCRSAQNGVLRIVVERGECEAEHLSQSMPEAVGRRNPERLGSGHQVHRNWYVCILCIMTTVSIVGSAGYTGQETLDRVLRHPYLTLVAIGSDSLAGRPASALDPRLADAGAPAFSSNAEALEHEADVTIVCLSHAAASAIEPPPGRIVIDLSGAHRLRDPASYEAWYGFAHPHPDGLGEWFYGLTELVEETGRLIANPGCYATAALLALGPLRAAIDPESVVVDGLSGMTGAGRTLKDATHSGVVLENVSPYKVGTHQHVPEIAQFLGFPVSFTPHLLPLRRGLIATCNVRSTGPDLRGLLEDAYAGSGVVRVLPEGSAPDIARVQHTDRAEIGVFRDGFTDRTIVICAEDNLGKGAAGQAIQNVNRMLGLSDTAGLRLDGFMV